MTELDHSQVNSYIAVVLNSVLDEADLETLVGNLWGSARLSELMPLLRRRSGIFDCHILMHSHWRVIGHAKIFHRHVMVGDRIINVLALSAVFIAPDYRGRGCGRRLVQAALEHDRYAVCMWQTSIPDFYTKLGARILRHPFVGSPWSDPYVMVYPAFDFGEGKIDIQGEAW